MARPLFCSGFGQRSGKKLAALGIGPAALTLSVLILSGIAVWVILETCVFTKPFTVSKTPPPSFSVISLLSSVPPSPVVPLATIYFLPLSVNLSVIIVAAPCQVLCLVNTKAKNIGK